ncbi:hypothetical protein HRbin40_01190 [bacterium HR40]|nr:hypothetical protein HRbin40_01190 [bacterium HR40]
MGTIGFSIPSMRESAVSLACAPLAFALSALVASIAARHPRLFARLGAHAGKVFCIDPIDLPFAILLRPRPERPFLALLPRGRSAHCDCRIAGTLAALLALLHGRADADALFFAGEIVMEGDTEAALGLRHAIDDAELDLLAEAAALLGQPGSLIAALLRPAVATLSHLWGLPLTRAESWP